MYKDFLKLTIPNILTNLTVPLVSLVDVFLMGHLDGPRFIIAIGLSVAIFNMLYWAFGFLRMGTTGMVAQYFGRKDNEGIQKIITQGLIIAVALGSLFICSQNAILLASKLVIDVSSDTFTLISDYFKIRIFAAPASIILFVINGWLLGVHKSKVALYLALLINTVNIVLSYVLVKFYGLGIKGAAIGTLVAQYSGLLIGVGLLFKSYPRKWFFLFKESFGANSSWKSFIQVNSDLFIRTLCLLFTLTFFKINAAEFGQTLGAGNLLLLEFISLSAYGIDGLAFAAESISGKYFGLRNVKLLKKAVTIAFQIGLIIGALGSVIYFFWGELILEVLTNQQEVIDAAIPYLPWVIVAPILHSFAYVWDGIYIGCTASKQMKWSLLISTIGVFLPSYYLFSHSFGNHGVWLSITLFMVSRGLIQTILAKSIYKHL